jgi:hypothetical protein
MSAPRRKRRNTEHSIEGEIEAEADARAEIAAAFRGLADIVDDTGDDAERDN